MTFLSYLLIGFATSLISGVFGLLGGMILIMLLLLILSLPSAMLLSATVQIVANGWRAWLWRKHIVWRVLPPYMAGMCVAGCLVGMISFVPSKALAFFLMGLLPLSGILLKPWILLNIFSRVQAFIGAIVLTFVQIATGVSGPLLDLFYVNTSFSRQQIISTKAFTQTCGHMVRFLYYGTLTAMITGKFRWPSDLSIYEAMGCIAGTIAGTIASVPLVNRMSDKVFKRLLSILIFIVSLYCLWQSYRIWGGV